MLNRFFGFSKPSLITFRYQTRIDATKAGGPLDALVTIFYSFVPILQSGTGHHGDSPNCGSYGPISGTIDVEEGGRVNFDFGRNSGITIFYNAGDKPRDGYEVFGGYDSGYSGKIFLSDVHSFRIDLEASSAKMFSNKKLPLTTNFASHADKLGFISFLRVSLA